MFITYKEHQTEYSLWGMELKFDLMIVLQNRLYKGIGLASEVVGDTMMSAVLTWFLIKLITYMYISTH